MACRIPGSHRGAKQRHCSQHLCGCGKPVTRPSFLSHERYNGFFCGAAVILMHWHPPRSPFGRLIKGEWNNSTSVCWKFHFKMRFKAGTHFLDNGNILCLHRRLDFTEVHICQNLENCHLRAVFHCYVFSRENILNKYIELYNMHAQLFSMLISTVY